MAQSWENGQKPQSVQFLDDFEVKYLQVSFKLKVIFSTNLRPKKKKIIRAVFEKNFSVWFWPNLETFLQISPSQEFFSKIWLSFFYLYIPLTSCKCHFWKNYVNNQPTNQPIITNNTDFIGPEWCRPKTSKP